uniref:PPPDE domain-containing protein n=1 Tax=Leersia perrieri TaxID=77586 RepID=A0A0D9W7U5_9ORYZ
MSRAEFRSFIENLAGKYNSNACHLISKNCNHFTYDVCYITGQSVPGWVSFSTTSCQKAFKFLRLDTLQIILHFLIIKAQI